MNVTLPDGTVLQDVPDGTTKEQLRAKLASNGYDVSKLEEPTWGQRAQEGLQGIAGRFDEQRLGLRGLLLPTKGAQGVANRLTKALGGMVPTKENATPIPDTWAGAVGSGLADVATTLVPAGWLSKASQGLKLFPRVAANIGGNAAMSAALVPENRGVAAAFGGAGAALGDAVGGVVRKVAPMFSEAGRAGLSERRAGRVLVKALGEDAGAATQRMQDYLGGRSGMLADVPLTTAQAMRQAEGAVPAKASSALSKVQLGTAGAAADDFTDLLRRQNEALHNVATQRAGRDAGNLEALTAERATATDPLREGALRAADTSGQNLGDMLIGDVAAIASRSVPGSPQRGLADLVGRTLAGNPDARQLYELRKLLANKLSGPHMPGDDVAAVVKGAEREARGLMASIDNTLQKASSREYQAVQPDMFPEGGVRWEGTRGAVPTEDVRMTPNDPNQQELFAPPQQMELLNMPVGVQTAPGHPGYVPTSPGEAIPHGPNQLPLVPPQVQQAQPGQWNPYLKQYREMSVPVTSARAQGQITEALSPQGGPLVGDVPEVTRRGLSQAVKKFGSDKRGFERLDPAAKARYEEMQQFLQRNEEAMRSTKLGGTGGGGSQTAMQMSAGMDAAPSVAGSVAAMLGLPLPGAFMGVTRVGQHIIRADTRQELAQMMLDPQRAIKGIQAAMAQGKELSPAQVAFRATMRTGGTAAGAGAARQQ